MVLNFSPLLNYLELPEIIIEDDFVISETKNTEVLVRPSIETLLDIENLTALERFKVAYSKKLSDISALQLLEKTHKIKQLALPNTFVNYFQQRDLI